MPRHKNGAPKRKTPAARLVRDVLLLAPSKWIGERFYARSGTGEVVVKEARGSFVITRCGKRIEYHEFRNRYESARVSERRDGKRPC